MPMDPLSLDFWSMIGAALLCGSILGLERELRDKPTGLRTCILICVGTALFIRTSLLVGNDHSDPLRVLGQVVSGIGFLGGGVILSRGHIVTGVTTASVVWLLASIGALIGFRQIAAAVVVATVMVLVLVLFEWIERSIQKLKMRKRLQAQANRHITSKKPLCSLRASFFIERTVEAHS